MVAEKESIPSEILMLSAASGANGYPELEAALLLVVRLSMLRDRQLQRRLVNIFTEAVSLVEWMGRQEKQGV